MDNKDAEKKENGFVLTDDNIPKFKEPLRPLIIADDKPSKSPSVFLILLIVLLLTGGAIFGVSYYMKSIKNPPKKNNTAEPQETPKELIELTNEELNNYLNYIPIGVIDNTVPYFNKKSTVDEINKSLLVGMALGGAHEFVYCEEEECLPEEVTVKGFNAFANCYTDGTCDSKGYDYFSLDKVNNNLEKMYNLNFLDFGIKEYDIWPYSGYEIMYYNNGFLEKEAEASWNASVNHTIDKYEATKEELVIYDYAINDCNMCSGPRDFQNSNEIKNSILEQQSISDYIKEHKTDFTLYKHTFKNSELGYYWFSTEVVK